MSFYLPAWRYCFFCFPLSMESNCFLVLHSIFCFSINVFGTLSDASGNGALRTSMQNAADTRNDGTLLNATQNFDLNSALYNSLKRNIETCRYMEMNNPFPISTQNKSVFLLYVNIRSIYKNLDSLNHELL